MSNAFASHMPTRTRTAPPLYVSAKERITVEVARCIAAGEGENLVHVLTST